MKRTLVLGLFVLFITVTTGMVFAAEGRSISFTQKNYKTDVKVTAVKETKSGISITYQALETHPLGLNFLAATKYKGGSVKEYFNNEMMKKGSTYTPTLSTTDPSDITSVDVWLGPTKKEVQRFYKYDAAADQTLYAASQLGGLDDIISSYSTLIPVLSNIKDFKDTVQFLNDCQVLFQGAKYYKSLPDGDKEYERRRLLMTNLDVIEYVGGKGMGFIQGELLSIAVKGVKNAINATNAYNDNWQWIEILADSNYDYLGNRPYEEYATIGMRLYRNKMSLSKIKEVFEALEKLKNARK
jgi:hypothetical protein